MSYITDFRAPKFVNVLSAVAWASNHASGPFTAFIQGWSSYVLVEKLCGGWYWSYNSYTTDLEVFQ